MILVNPFEFAKDKREQHIKQTQSLLRFEISLWLSFCVTMFYFLVIEAKQFGNNINIPGNINTPWYHYTIAIIIIANLLAICRKSLKEAKGFKLYSCFNLFTIAIIGYTLANLEQTRYSYKTLIFMLALPASLCPIVGFFICLLLQQFRNPQAIKLVHEAQLYLQKQDLKRAEELLDLALKEFPEYTDALLLMAEIQQQWGNAELSAAACQIAKQELAQKTTAIAKEKYQKANRILESLTKMQKQQSKPKLAFGIKFTNKGEHIHVRILRVNLFIAIPFAFLFNLSLVTIPLTELSKPERFRDPTADFVTIWIMVVLLGIALPTILLITAGFTRFTISSQKISIAGNTDMKIADVQSIADIGSWRNYEGTNAGEIKIIRQIEITSHNNSIIFSCWLSKAETRVLIEYLQQLCSSHQQISP